MERCERFGKCPYQWTLLLCEIWGLRPICLEVPHLCAYRYEPKEARP